MSSYEEIFMQVHQLTLDEQLRLVEDLARIIRGHVRSEPKHSVLEFLGVGKEVWQGVDVEKYIEEERNSWER